MLQDAMSHEVNKQGMVDDSIATAGSGDDR